MMEESATACVSGDFSQALEKAKEAVSQEQLSVWLFRDAGKVVNVSLRENRQQ